MLLTAAAYKIVVSSILPPIPYLTLTDLYVLACCVAIILFSLHVAVVGRLAAEGWPYSQQLDNYGALANLVLYVLMNAALFTRLRLFRRRVHQEIEAAVPPTAKAANTDANEFVPIATSAVAAMALVKHVAVTPLLEASTKLHGGRSRKVSPL